MRILVTGARGMVGQAVTRHCAGLGDEVLSYDRQALDISDSSRVDLIVGRDQPEAIINCAAWTDVDGCEDDPEHSRRANAVGPENLAKACRRVGAVLVTISTDYVFDGTKEGFYTQRDDPNPAGVYGVTKLEGERMAQQANARTIVARAGFVFGTGGKNFLSTVVERVRQGAALKVIDDAWGTPTYAPHLAGRLRQLAERDLPGVFHVVNAGPGASYEEFARVALEAAGLSTDHLVRISMHSLNRRAPRPVNSRLKCLLSEAIGLPALPFWEDAVREFVSSPIAIETAI